MGIGATLPEGATGDVRYPSTVAVAIADADGGDAVTDVGGGYAAPYGAKITITATMDRRRAASNALAAVVGTVDFWLGEAGTGIKLTGEGENDGIVTEVDGT